MQIIIILIKSSNVVSKFYRLINTDTFNTYSLLDLSSYTFHLFPWNRATLNHLKNKLGLICMYRISSNKHILYGIVGFNYGWNKRSVTEPDTSIDKEYDMFLLF